ncbi:AIG2-like protein C [Lachnellula suecica]|uniref:Putative gamma-glutamylcyclotransferase n=1 Tax=Lachnellula suecica TaxID=602035 RepID=A0A8T9CHB5_9HELO|nr:AIG2-like protein C [Lachnellula suecica]
MDKPNDMSGGYNTPPSTQPSKPEACTSTTKADGSEESANEARCIRTKEDFEAINATPQQATSPEEFPGRAVSVSKRTYAQEIPTYPLRAPSVPFTPCYMFFYGSLMDTDVLHVIAQLPKPPTMVPATVSGFQMKMWSIYPTLIKRDGFKVSGTLWKAEEEEQFLRLQSYETAAYTWCFCDVELEDGSVMTGCRTFCWSGEPESRDLSDGKFDLETYQREHKSPLFYLPEVRTECDCSDCSD